MLVRWGERVFQGLDTTKHSRDRQCSPSRATEGKDSLLWVPKTHLRDSPPSYPEARSVV